MILHDPFIITSRLLPGIKVADGTISITFNGETHDGRAKYLAYLDLADGREFVVDDMASGVGGGRLQDGMSSLLSFMGASAEAYRYEMGGLKSENIDLFAPDVVEWCYQNDGELAMLQCELDEKRGELLCEES
jgi:hypothetical protein